MLSGYAYYVQHSRRRDQDYVSVDTEYVAKDVLQTARDLGWPVKVGVVNYRGDGALSVIRPLEPLCTAITAMDYTIASYEGSGSEETLIVRK